MWPIFRFLMSTHMVPFAVYSAFETSQLHVQDGGSHKACVNNSKICAKAWGKWRQNRIIPSLLLRKIGSDCWRTAKTGWNFGFHSFLAALTITRNIEKKMTSQFPLKISGGQLQEINFSVSPDFHASLTLFTSSPDKVLSNNPELNPFKSYQTFT